MYLQTWGGGSDRLTVFLQTWRGGGDRLAGVLLLWQGDRLAGCLLAQVGGSAGLGGGEWRTWSTMEGFCPGDMYSVTDCSVSAM
jgi:hypothetical protein